MSLNDYAADIGLTYVMIPIITVGFGVVLKRMDAGSCPGESSHLRQGRGTLVVPVHGKKDLHKGTGEAIKKMGGLK